MGELYFLTSLQFNTTQSSACTLKLFYTRSIKDDKSFLKQKSHILYNLKELVMKN